MDTYSGTGVGMRTITALLDAYCFKVQWDVDIYCVRGVGMWILTVLRDNGMWTLTALRALGCGHLQL